MKMKRFLRTISLFLAIVIVFTICPPSCAQAGSTNSTARKAYQSILKSELKEFENEKMAGETTSWTNLYNMFYRYCDINSDGVDELIVIRNYGGDKTLVDFCKQTNIAIYTYYKRKVCKLLEMYSNGSELKDATYSTANKSIMISENMDSRTENRVYKISNGKLVLNKTIKKIMKQDKDSSKVVCYINKKKISQSTYEKEIKKYSAQEKVTYTMYDYNTVMTSPIVATHKVYSDKLVEDRIKTIRDYYYNKPKELTAIETTFQLYFTTYDFTYYLNGNDLMFAYGTDGENEYRLYFYKNQLIQMLYDQQGQERKTYTQLYETLESPEFDPKLAMYMDLEGYFRKLMEPKMKKINQVVSDELVLVTKVEGSKITYHRLSVYGPDGCMWSMCTPTYIATLDSNVKVMDYSENPMEYELKDTAYLYDLGKQFIGFACDLEETDGKVSGILLPYWP